MLAEYDPDNSSTTTTTESIVDSVENQYRDFYEEVCLVGQDLEEISLRHFGVFALRRIDLSFNNLRLIKGIQLCRETLEELILDNNMLQSIGLGAHFPKLHTLSLSKNLITSLQPILDDLGANAPNLTYLSLLGNPICPDQLSDLSSCHAQQPKNIKYEQFRSHVIFHVKSLSFLDSRPVSSTEFRNAKRNKIFSNEIPLGFQGNLDLFRAKFNSLLSLTPLTSPIRVTDAFPEVLPSSEKFERKSKAGKRRYKYVGKNSEGNRFIRDGDL